MIIAKDAHLDAFLLSQYFYSDLKLLKLPSFHFQELCMLIFSLEELYLSGNSYTDVTLNIPAYQSLRLLQLTSNNISDWLQIAKLDQLLPSLDNLVLAENPISNCGKTIKCFHHESTPDARKFQVYMSVIMK